MQLLDLSHNEIRLVEHQCYYSCYLIKTKTLQRRNKCIIIVRKHSTNIAIHAFYLNNAALKAMELLVSLSRV